MPKVFTIALLHIRMTFKSKGALITMFLVPLVLTMIIGGMLGGAGSGSAGHVYPVAVVDLDGGFAARALVETLSQEPSFRISFAEEQKLGKLFSDQLIEAGIVIPVGFTEGVAAGTAPEVKLLSAPGSNLYLGVGPAVSRDVARVAQDYRVAYTAAGRDTSRIGEIYAQILTSRKDTATGVAVSQVQRDLPGRPSFTQNLGTYSVGFAVTFVMMTVFSGAGAILAERQRGTWGRLLISPTSRGVLLGGYLLNFFLTGMAQFAILVGATRLLFGIAWGPWLPLTVMAAATVLCAGGMGLFLAGIVKTYEQQSTIAVLFVNATSMLGGVYWDLSFVGENMRRIGYLTPQAWAIEGFREVMLRGGSWGALSLPLAVLMGITAVFMTAGLLRIRYE